MHFASSGEVVESPEEVAALAARPAVHPLYAPTSATNHLSNHIYFTHFLTLILQIRVQRIKLFSFLIFLLHLSG